MPPITYQSAGVDLKLYDEAMSRLPAMMSKTHTPRVIPLNDAFAGLFRLNHQSGPGQHSYHEPVLVSGTDGVGTKLKVAARMGRLDTVGIDCVAMCVNDVLCLGAEPLFFLDYLALSHDDPDRVAALVKGVSDGCVESGCALMGGETAILPDIYPRGEFDLAGFCVGVVEKAEIIDGKALQPGDILIGLSSSGFHSNGYSLIRRVVFDHAGLEVGDIVPAVGKTVGEILLEPTRLYPKYVLPIVRALSASRGLSGLAHITGGGLRDNIERFLPEGIRVEIARSKWTPAASFRWLQELGSIEEEEMYRVFNMGIGFVLIVRAEHAEAALRMARELDPLAVTIGRAVAGTRGVEYVETLDTPHV